MAEDDNKGRPSDPTRQRNLSGKKSGKSNDEKVNVEIAQLSANVKAMKKQIEEVLGFTQGRVEEFNRKTKRTSEATLTSVVSTARKETKDLYLDLEQQHERFLSSFVSREKGYAEKVSEIWGDIKRASSPHDPPPPGGVRTHKGSYRNSVGVTPDILHSEITRVTNRLDKMSDEMSGVLSGRVSEETKSSKSDGRIAQEEVGYRRERAFEGSSSKAVVGTLSDIKKILYSVLEEDRSLSKVADPKRKKQTSRRAMKPILGLEEDDIDKDFFNLDFLGFEVEKLSGDISHYKREAEKYFEDIGDRDISDASRKRKRGIIEESKGLNMERSELLKILRNRKEAEDLQRQVEKDKEEIAKEKETLKTAKLSEKEMEDLNNNIESLNKEIEKNNERLSQISPKSRDEGIEEARRERQLRDSIKEREYKLPSRIEMDNFLDETRDSIIKTTTGLVKKYFDVFFSKLESGFTKFASFYETSFTEIASRVGTNSRDETNQLYTNLIDQMTKTLPYSSMNINDELLPYLQKATSTGLQGQDLILKASTDAISAKFMPWLDTQTDAWTQMFTYMSTDAIQNMQAQQLLLRTSQAGNRLLQSGVVNNLMSKIEPLLRSIDFNTGGAESLPAEYQAIMANLVDEKGGNMTPEEAFNLVSDMINVQNDRAAALNSGNPLDQLLALANGPEEMTKVMAEQIKKSITDTSGPLGDIVAGNIGTYLGTSKVVSTNTKGGYENAYRGLNYQGYKKTDDPAVLAAAYKKELSNTTQKITPTDEWSNALENVLTKTVGVWISQIPFGSDMFSSLTNAVGDVVSTVLDMKVLKMVKSMMAGMNGGGVSEGSGGPIAIGGSGKGFLSGAFGKLGGGLLNDPASVGKLAKGVNLLGIGLGLTEGIYGITNSVNDFKQAGKASNTDKESAVLKSSGVLDAAGGLSGVIGATTLAFLGLSNPVGWAAIAIGGLALGGSKLVKYLGQESASVQEVSKKYDEQRELMKQESDARMEQIKSLKQQIDSTDDLEEKRKILVNQGLATEDEAKAMPSDEIDARLAMQTLLDQNKKKNADTIFSELQKQGKNETGKVVNEDFKNYLLNLIKGKSVEEQQNILRTAGFTEDSIKQIGGFRWQTLKTTSAEDIINGGYRTGMFDNRFANDNRGMAGQAGVNIDTANSVAMLYGGQKSKIFKTNMDEQIAQQISDAAGTVESFSDLLKQGRDIGQKNTDDYNNALSFLLKNRDLISNIPELQDLNRFYRDPSKSYATGLTYAYDDATVRIHEGEGILTKAENSAYLATAQTLPVISKLFGEMFADLKGTISESSSDSDNEKLISAINASSARIVDAIVSSTKNKNVEAPKDKFNTKRPQYDSDLVGLNPTM